MHGAVQASPYRPEIDGLRALAVVAVIINHFNLAVVSYLFLERPLRHKEWPVVRRKSFGYGFSALMGAIMCLIVLMNMPQGILYIGTFPTMVAAGTNTLVDKYESSETSSAWNGEECVLSDNKQVGKLILISGCTLGDFENAKHRVLVVGDSFSASFVQAFDQLVTSDNYSVTITCASYVPGFPLNHIYAKASDYYWGNVVPSLASNLRRGDWMLLINRIADFDRDPFASEFDERMIQLESGLSKLSKQLSEMGVHLGILISLRIEEGRISGSS